MARKRVRFAAVSTGPAGRRSSPILASNLQYSTRRSPYVDYLPEYDQDMYVVSAVPTRRSRAYDYEDDEDPTLRRRFRNTDRGHDYEAEFDDAIMRGKAATRLGSATMDDTDALYNRSRRSDRGLIDSIDLKLQRMEMNNIKVDNDIRDKVGFRRFIYAARRRKSEEGESSRRKQDNLKYPRVKNKSLRVEPSRAFELHLKYLEDKPHEDGLSSSAWAGTKSKTMRNQWIPRANVPRKERAKDDLDMYELGVVDNVRRRQLRSQSLDDITDKVTNMRNRVQAVTSTLYDDTRRYSLDDLKEEEYSTPRRRNLPVTYEVEEEEEPVRTIYVVGGGKKAIDPKEYDHLEPGNYMVFAGTPDPGERPPELDYYNTQRRILAAEIDMHKPDTRIPKSLLLTSEDFESRYVPESVLARVGGQDDLDRRPSSRFTKTTSMRSSAVPPRPSSNRSAYKPLYQGEQVRTKK